MSLEERTLVVRNFDGRVHRSLLFELFHQAGPVINVVLRSDFAFIEFEHKISVGYAMALFDGIHLFGHQLRLSPKLQSEPSYYKFLEDMNRYFQVIQQNPNYFLQFMEKDSVQNHRNRRNSGHYDDYHNNRSHSYRRQSEQNRYSTERRYSDRHSNNYRY